MAHPKTVCLLFYLYTLIDRAKQIFYVIFKINVVLEKLSNFDMIKNAND